MNVGGVGRGWGVWGGVGWWAVGVGVGGLWWRKGRVRSNRGTGDNRPWEYGSDREKMREEPSGHIYNKCGD